LEGGPTVIDGTERAYAIARGMARSVGQAIGVMIRALERAAAGGRKVKPKPRVRRASRRHLIEAQRIARIGSFEFDVATGEIEWSEENYRIFGVEQEEGPLSFDRLIEHVVPEDRNALRRTVERLERGLAPVPEEFRIRRSDGSIRTLRSELEATRDHTGKIIKAIGIDRDVTALREAERRRDELEKQLLQSQKLEALGMLASGIAHDLNNALVPIIALSVLLLKKAAPGGPDAEELALIHEAGVHARDLVAGILAFARKAEPARRPLDLALFVHQELRLLHATLPSMIAIEERIEPVPSILADEGKIRQVLMNLVTNAAQAIGYAQGVIKVELEVANPSPLAGGRDMVRLAVGDTGCGMDETTRQQIFDPFFTTKPVGEGTGLGLSVVHGIVVSHGGMIAVESNPGLGSRFEIYLPIAGDAAPDARSPERGA
jgi:PAS domain S-box-containing protein